MANIDQILNKLTGGPVKKMRGKKGIKSKKLKKENVNDAEYKKMEFD